jgi:hypothetical protein
METSDLRVTFLHSSLDVAASSFFYATIISSLKVGVRVMLNNDKSSNILIPHIQI